MQLTPGQRNDLIHLLHNSIANINSLHSMELISKDERDQQHDSITKHLLMLRPPKDHICVVCDRLCSAQDYSLKHNAYVCQTCCHLAAQNQTTDGKHQLPRQSQITPTRNAQ